MRLFEKNSFIHGIISGIAFPLISLGLIKGILYVLSQTVNENYDDWRLRTISLIAICSNFIPFQMHKRNFNDESMRGITIPTLIFGIAWIFVYRAFIFGDS